MPGSARRQNRRRRSGDDHLAIVLKVEGRAAYRAVAVSDRDPFPLFFRAGIVDIGKGAASVERIVSD